MNWHRRLFLKISSVLASLSLAGSAVAQQRPHFTLQQMEEMFKNIRAHTKFNPDGDLAWGYTFMDPQAEKLRALAKELATSGYRTEPVKPSTDGKTQVLHVERIEMHTPRTMHERNQQLYRLAEKYKVALYDGMDVGPSGPMPR